uniref:Uncharacterized protein n=1 Tax=Oryza brachyantha TaxID=4533 RepID=J3L8J6_ORYBR
PRPTRPTSAPGTAATDAASAAPTDASPPSLPIPSPRPNAPPPPLREPPRGPHPPASSLLCPHHLLLGATLPPRPCLRLRRPHLRPPTAGVLLTCHSIIDHKIHGLLLLLVHACMHINRCVWIWIVLSSAHPART